VYVADLCVVRSRGRSGDLVVRVGVSLADVYLEFLGGRCRPNTVLAATSRQPPLRMGSGARRLVRAPAHRPPTVPLRPGHGHVLGQSSGVFPVLEVTPLKMIVPYNAVPSKPGVSLPVQGEGQLRYG
jgi:hypothetical protein